MAAQRAVEHEGWLKTWRVDGHLNIYHTVTQEHTSIANAILHFSDGWGFLEHAETMSTTWLREFLNLSVIIQGDMTCVYNKRTNALQPLEDLKA